MMIDEDYMEFMSDTLFSSLSANQPFAFPDTREIGKLVSYLSAAEDRLYLRMLTAIICISFLEISLLFALSIN